MHYSSLLLLMKYLMLRLQAVLFTLRTLSPTTRFTIQPHPFPPHRYNNAPSEHSGTKPWFRRPVAHFSYGLVRISLCVLSTTRAALSISSRKIFLISFLVLSVRFVHCVCVHIQRDSRQVGVAIFLPVAARRLHCAPSAVDMAPVRTMVQRTYHVC